MISWTEAVKISQNLKIKKDYKFSFIILFSIHTGLKINEILEIKWKDILNKNSIITNNNNIYINKILQKEILFFYKKMNIDNIDNFIFVNKSNNKLSTQYINSKLKKIALSENVENFSTNILRKIFGREIYKNSNYSSKILIELSKFYCHAHFSITKKYLEIENENDNNNNHINIHKILENEK